MTDADELQWWEERNPADAAKKVVATAKAIEEAQRARRRRNLMHARLYANQDLESIYDFGVADSFDSGVYLTLNVIQSCSDTITAKIARSKPRVQFLTHKGNYSLKRQAQDLTVLCDGVFDANDWHGNESSQVFADATLFGSGVVITEGDADAGEVVIDRVIPDEMLFDETEALYGLKSLWNLFRKKHVHKQVLLRLFPQARQAIKSARGSSKLGSEPLYGKAGDMIPVYYGWHKASARGKDDGRFILCLEGEDGLLASRPYKRTKFPASFFAWQKPIAGLWGRSLAEELVPIQLKINDLLEVIDAGQKLNGVDRIFVQDQMVDQEHISNLIASVIKTVGPPSQAVHVVPGRGASPEMYEEVETWFRRAFEKTGISQLSATAEKPEGIGSAVALRELLDREDMRFATVGQRWEAFHADIGEQVVEAADELYENRGKLTVQVPGDKFIRSVEWKKVDLGRSMFKLRPFPTSSMPTTPGAKRQYVTELWEAQAIDKPQFLQLLELPDTSSAVSLIISSLENTDRAIELMLDEGKPQQPERFSDLTVARARVMQAYLAAKNDGAPEKRLDLLRRYVARCSEMLRDEQPANTNAQPAVAAADPTAPPPTDPAAPPPGGAPPPEFGPPPEVPMQEVAPDVAVQAPPPVEPVPAVA